MDRETIIRDVARTLFVCAWADGVEAGEIAGEGPGAGGDWMDAAPRTYRLRLDGKGRQPCTVPGCRLRSVAGIVRGLGLCPYHYDARQFGPAWADRCLEVPDPAAEAEARRIVDGFDAAQTAGPRPDGVPHIVDAAEIHAELSGTDRFAYCLAMTALGHGVGLEDDLPSGVRLPGWIRASVPSSDFSYLDLDPERYPAPERSADADEVAP